MPAAGIEPGQKVLSPLPSLSPLLSLPSLVTPHLISFRFRFCGLWPVLGLALPCLAVPSSSFWLSLYFGQLFRTAFAVAEQQQRGVSLGKGCVSVGNMCKFDS